MSIQNHTWVCWKCRKTHMRSRYQFAICSECGKPMVWLDRKYKVPKKRDDKGWERMHKDWLAKKRSDRFCKYYKKNTPDWWEVEKLRGNDPRK